MSDSQQPDKGKERKPETDIVRPDIPVDTDLETPQDTTKEKSPNDSPRKMRWPADFPAKH